MATRFLAPYYNRGLRSYDPLADLHREMNRLFDDVFSFGGGAGGGMSAFAASPRLDMHESDQELTIEAELPGVDSKDLDVRLDGDMLTISGEKRSRRDDKQNPHLSECSYGRFQRTVQLPFRPEGDDIRADFEGGVLKVSVPKRPEAQQGSRRIEVRAGQRSLQGGGAAGEAGGQAMTSAVGGGDTSSRPGVMSQGGGASQEGGRSSSSSSSAEPGSGAKTATEGSSGSSR